MSKPKFSVIIPVYNVENYLKQCIDSVVNQTYNNFEIILVDDGSLDNCPNICDEYVNNDSRIKVIHKKNEGLSSARNDGLLLAKGQYVIFLDSDDYYLKLDFFEEIDYMTEDSDLQLICFQRRKYLDDKKELLVEPKKYSNYITNMQSGDVLYELSRIDLLDASASMKVIKKEVLINNNLFFKKGIYSEDVEWFFRLANCVDKIMLLDSIPYCYRIRNSSISHNITQKNIEDLFYSIKKYSTSLLQNDKSLKNIGLLNYLAYQYYIILGLISKSLSKENKKIFLKKSKNYKWLTKYSISPKTKKAAFMVRLFGVDFASYVLGKYIKLKIK